jgi:microcystin-dependent protein
MADTLRIKRRPTGGAAGAPASLAASELAYNEVDDTLYYGWGNSSGVATVVKAIAGPGAYQPKDADLTALAALTATNAIFYRSAADTWAQVTIGSNLTFVGGTLDAPATGATPSHGFNAHKTADQTITADTWTKLVFGTTTYNNGSYFDTGTSRYTPPAGETCFIASVYCEGVLPGANYYLAIYKNGTLHRFATNNTTNGTAQIFCSDQASGTDYYEAWVYGSTSGGTFSVLNGNNDAIFFQGFQPLGPVGPQGPPGQVQVSGTPTAGQVATFVNGTTITGTDLWSTGDVKPTIKIVADAGWVMMDDGTIGDASSSATTRANVDCLNLFTLIWNVMNDTNAPVPGGRGANAAADWAAHKRITLPRMLGRALASAGAGAGLTSRPVGGWLGEETHTQIVAEMPAHNHGFSDPSHTHGGMSTNHIHYYPANYLNVQASYVTIDGGSTYNVSLWGGYHTNTNYTDIGQPANAGTGISFSSNGGGSPFNVMQPTTFLNFMIKL